MTSLSYHPAEATSPIFVGRSHIPYWIEVIIRLMHELVLLLGNGRAVKTYRTKYGHSASGDLETNCFNVPLSLQTWLEALKQIHMKAVTLVTVRLVMCCF